MFKDTLTWGSSGDWVLQIINRDGSKPTAGQFLSTDTITSAWWQGQNYAALFAPTVSWFSADNGQVNFNVSNSQCATLEQSGEYLFNVTVARDGVSSVVFEGAITILPAPGTGPSTTSYWGTTTVVPYCKYADVLAVAPWVARVQSTDFDQEGFLTQRLQTRQWYDQVLLNNYRGAFVGLFETHSTMAFAFGYAGWRRSLGPSPSLITYLANNYLLVKPYVVNANAHWAASLIGLNQIGRDNSLVSYGAFHRDQAERFAIASTAEVDLNNDGVGELFINVGTTNTLFS